MAIKRLLTLKGALLTTSMLVVLAVGGYFIANRNTSDKQPLSTATSTEGSTDQDDGVNMDPPTAEEKAQADSQKEQNVERANQDSSSQNPTSSKRSVTPVITSAEGSPTTVRGYINGVAEDGGTCTATFTQAGKPTVTATSKGFKNVSTTNCEPITAQLSGGTWSIVLNYVSANAEGKSASKPLSL